MIDLYTFYLGGRPKYLQRCIDSISTAVMQTDSEIVHHICLQGCKLEPHIYIPRIGNYTINIHHWESNIGIGLGINKIKSEFKYPYCMKIDDDCLIHSSFFFNHVKELNEQLVGCVYSPYPVGLINNPGGVHSNPKQHSVIYSDKTDTWYTLRRVPHVGGFARISPTQLIVDCEFLEDLSQTQSGNEDGVFSNFCNSRNIPMYYLENALVVEHQESTIGQHKRYGTEYFGKRF